MKLILRSGPGSRMCRRIAAAAVGIALAASVSAACSAPGGRGGGGTTAVGVPTGSTSYPAVGTEGGDAADSSTDSSLSPDSPSPDSSPGTTDMTPPSTRSATAATRPTAPAVPGGTGDIAALVAAGDLAAGGKIDLYGTGVPAGGAPSDPVTTATLCGYLFGTTAEVAEIGRLAGDVTLDPISGRHAAPAPADDADGPAAPTSARQTTALTATAAPATPTAPTAPAAPTATAAGAGADPVLIACVYRSDGVPVLALQVGDGPPIDPNLPGNPLIVEGAGLHAVLSYAPDHRGATISPSTARDWLDAVIDRVAPTGSRTG